MRGVATNGGGLKLIKGPTDPQWSESAETWPILTQQGRHLLCMKICLSHLMRSVPFLYENDNSRHASEFQAWKPIEINKAWHLMSWPNQPPTRAATWKQCLENEPHCLLDSIECYLYGLQCIGMWWSFNRPTKRAITDK